MSTGRIESLVREVQSLPDARARNTAMELVQAVMDLHAAGLSRMVEIISQADAGGGIASAIAADSTVSGVLLLHDLHPLNLNARVTRALDRPEFRARGARVELLSIADGVVRVHVEGGPALRSAVETALYEAAPDAAAIDVEGSAGDAAANGFVPLEQLLAT